MDIRGVKGHQRRSTAIASATRAATQPRWRQGLRAQANCLIQAVFQWSSGSGGGRARYLLMIRRRRARALLCATVLIHTTTHVRRKKKNIPLVRTPFLFLQFVLAPTALGKIHIHENDKTFMIIHINNLKPDKNTNWIEAIRAWGERRSSDYNKKLK